MVSIWIVAASDLLKLFVDGNERCHTSNAQLAHELLTSISRSMFYYTREREMPIMVNLFILNPTNLHMCIRVYCKHFVNGYVGIS